MYASLIKIMPFYDGLTDRRPIYLSSANDRRVTGIGGTRWEPAIVEAPAIGMQFWNGDFTEGTDVGQTRFSFNALQSAKSYPEGIDAALMGADVEIMIDRVGAEWPWKKIFVGKITDFSSTNGVVYSISAAVDLEPFNANVLNKTYAGTGDGEGGADLKEQVKPLALGWPQNVEPVLINEAYSVYQFSAYGPIQAVTTLYERASAFPPPVADYPDYAALIAASISPGMWATCLALGMVRLGAPAYGVITGDVKGHMVGSSAPRTVGSFVKIIAEISEVDESKISIGSLARLDNEGATNSDIMITEQVTFLEAARRMILPCNWQVVVSNLGVMIASKPAFANQSGVLHAQGRFSPRVSDISEQSTSLPYKKTIMAAERAWRTQTFDEISTSATLIDRGDYDAATVYREGNIVTMPGGSRWEFVSNTPQAGVTPGTDPLIWANMEGGSTYSDGTSIDALQPAESGATQGAPSGTPVGSIEADDVSSTINSGGGVAPDQVNTGAILDNAVSESNFNILELFGASVGTDDDNVWRDFAYLGVALTGTFNNPTGGADATALFWVTMVGVRTGGDNDRISVRIRREDGAILLPAEHTNLLFESGGNTVYTMPFFDPDPVVGVNTYTVQTKNLEGHPSWQRGIIVPLRLAK